MNQACEGAAKRIWKTPCIATCLFNATSEAGTCNRLDQFTTIENVVEVLNLARLGNAPDLYFKCAKFVTEIAKQFKKQRVGNSS